LEDPYATIIYFEGGDGKVLDPSSRVAHYNLINRSMHYFRQKGIRIICKDYYIPESKIHKVRGSKKHFDEIQKTVNRVRQSGHKNVYLMGLSNGTYSVMYCGTKDIKGVDGLISINAPREAYSPQTRNGILIDYKMIKLPFLMVTHEYDNGMYKGWSPSFFSSIFSSSVMPRLVVLSGGRIGGTAEATHLSQRYQHGLKGVEKEFVQTVYEFINSVENKQAL
jgi:hypothetical protein